MSLIYCHANVLSYHVVTHWKYVDNHHEWYMENLSWSATHQRNTPLLSIQGHDLVIDYQCSNKEWQLACSGIADDRRHLASQIVARTGGVIEMWSGIWHLFLYQLKMDSGIIILSWSLLYWLYSGTLYPTIWTRLSSLTPVAVVNDGCRKPKLTWILD